LPTTGAHTAGPQIREFASTTLTLPPISFAATLMGESCRTALEVGTSHIARSVACCSTHVGTSSTRSGDSLIGVTEIPASSSCVQYLAIPAPISATAAGDSKTGWSGVAMFG
jgi:hypothetical protein